MESQMIVSLITDLGSFGFILWLVHRTHSVTIPRLASSFEKAIDTMRASFEAALDRQRADFRETNAQQRTDFERMITREQQIHAEQTGKLVEAIGELATREAV